MSKKLNRGIWVGLEVEGPHAGELTVFIMGDVNWARIKQTIDEHVQNEHLKGGDNIAIYFGAGRNPKFRPDAIKCAVQEGYYPITLELRGDYANCYDEKLGRMDLAIRKHIEVVRVYTEKDYWNRHTFERVKIEFTPTRGLGAGAMDIIQVFEKPQMLALNVANPLLPGDKLLWSEFEEEVEHVG